MLLQAEPAAVLGELLAPARRAPPRPAARRHLGQLGQLGGGQRPLGDEQERLEEGAERRRLIGSPPASSRARSGRTASFCSTRTCRRRTSSRVARSVTVGLGPGSAGGQERLQHDAPAPRQRGAQDGDLLAIVISRATISGGGAPAPGSRPALASAAARTVAGSGASGASGRSASRGSRRMHRRQPGRAAPSAARRVAQGAVLDQAAAQLLLVGLVRRHRPRPAAARRAACCRDLMRISWAAMATNSARLAGVDRVLARCAT